MQNRGMTLNVFFVTWKMKMSLWKGIQLNWKINKTCLQVKPFLLGGDTAESFLLPSSHLTSWFFNQTMPYYLQPSFLKKTPLLHAIAKILVLETIQNDYFLWKTSRTNSKPNILKFYKEFIELNNWICKSQQVPTSDLKVAFLRVQEKCNSTYLASWYKKFQWLAQSFSFYY